ncbi:hypothetical protein BJV74DRAFT_113479 [Russula compacta]|nr:hypothetical protein BJV74DRAFT_113479 [Russula compacta]
MHHDFRRRKHVFVRALPRPLRGLARYTKTGEDKATVWLRFTPSFFALYGNVTNPPCRPTSHISLLRIHALSIYEFAAHQLPPSKISFHFRGERQATFVRVTCHCSTLPNPARAGTTGRATREELARMGASWLRSAHTRTLQSYSTDHHHAKSANGVLRTHTPDRSKRTNTCVYDRLLQPITDRSRFSACANAPKREWEASNEEGPPTHRVCPLTVHSPFANVRKITSEQHNCLVACIRSRMEAEMSTFWQVRNPPCPSHAPWQPPLLSVQVPRTARPAQGYIWQSGPPSPIGLRDHVGGGSTRCCRKVLQ